MSFTRRVHPLPTTYNIKGEVLNDCHTVKDLGVVLHKDLNFVKHVQSSSAKAKRNMGIIMRHSRFFSHSGTLRILYFSLVRAHLDFASVVWSPSAADHSAELEKIQKRFLRYLYYKDFNYYDWEISYRELGAGYTITTLHIRRDVTLLLFLRDIVNSRIDSSPLLEKITFYVPPRTVRRKNTLFFVPICRTQHFRDAPLNRARILYNIVEEIDTSIDIFYNSRKEFAIKISEALMKHHS